MHYGIYIFPAFLVTLVLTEYLRRSVFSRQWLDVPNARSSHERPTPRGGGVVFAAVFLLAGAALMLTEPQQAQPPALFGGLLLVAVCGLLDDRYSLSARLRLLMQGTAALWLTVSIPGLPALPVFGETWHFGFEGYLLAWLFLVWLLNLFNFMDGIDGIAATQAISVLVCGALCHWLAGSQQGLPVLALVLAAACAGFLCLNWPPARIFMGDSGSAFLGFAMAAMALLAARENGALFWCWVLLMGVFVVDATVTLLRRILRGEKPSEAHRSHAYQHASRRLGAHRPVTLAVLAINVLWLLPLALLVAAGKLDGAAATFVAYAPLVLLAFFLGAGTPDASPRALKDDADHNSGFTGG